MKLKKAKTKFAAAVWREGKQYVSQCLNVDVASFGRTKSEALEKLQEALELYLMNERGAFPSVESPAIVMGEFSHA